MNERIELKGMWWLPSNPETKVAGMFTFIPGESIVLELIGALGKVESALDAFLSKRDEDVIFGVTSDAQEVTLFNCGVSGSLNFNCPFPITRYTCQYAIIGAHVNSTSDNRFFEATVKFPLISQWCSPCALSTTFYSNENDKFRSCRVEFDCKRNVLHSVDIDGNTSLNLEGAVDYHGDCFSPKIEQSTILRICKKCDSSVEGFLHDIFMYEQFLSFAALQEVRCSGIILHDKEAYQELKDNEKLYDSIRLVYVQREYSAPSDEKNGNFLFRYETIKEQYDSIIRKWYLEKDDIAPIRQHLISSIRSKTVFTSVDFLIVIQAVEGFWWRFRDNAYKVKNSVPQKQNTQLNTILDELLKEFGDVKLLKGLGIDIAAAVDSRHYYSHFMERGKKKNIVDGYELYVLTEKLTKLLICCLLSFVGFNNNEVDVILNKSYNRLLR